MRIAILLAFSFVARAQLTLVVCQANPPVTVGSTYNLGTVAIGTTQTVSFCAQNSGNTPVIVTLPPTVSGAGFSLVSVNGSIPYTVAPSNFLEFTVSFYVAPSPLATLGTYSASLVLTEQPGNSISVLLLATLVAGPTLTVLPPSTCSTSANTIAFQTLLNGSLHLCNVLVTNQSTQPLAISNITATGSFQLASLPALPLTLAPGGAGITFAIEITPACGSGALGGTLVLTGSGVTFSYSLSGQGADPPLATPALAVAGSNFVSGEQYSLSMSLASPAVCAAKGNVALAFTPAKGIPVADDMSIVFLSGSTRSLPFSVSAGSTTVLISGQTSASFQSGTTAGTITFSANGIPFASGTPPSLPITIPPAPVSIQTAAASNQITGQLNIEIVGFDNTYSAGPMTFTFADTNGNPIGGTVNADFTSSFDAFFITQTAGSTFLIRVSFPVQGNQAEVGTVAVTMTNSAGQAQTGTLTFQ